MKLNWSRLGVSSFLGISKVFQKRNMLNFCTSRRAKSVRRLWVTLSLCAFWLVDFKRPILPPGPLQKAARTSSVLSKRTSASKGLSSLATRSAILDTLMRRIASAEGSGD